MPKMKSQPSQKDIVRAYKAAKEGKMSIREAALKYNIPKSTLIDKVKGKSPLDCRKGPKAILSPEEEKSLRDWGVKMAGIGYTCIRTQIMYTVKTIMDKDEKEGRGRKKRFGNNNLPGKDWWGRFCERHLKLKKATAQVAERTKKLYKSDAALCKWQTSLKKFLQKQGIRDGSCIFTCTANRFLVDGHRGTVKYCNAKRTKEGAKYLTVLTAASANGKFVPPMIIYHGDHADVDLLEDEAVEGTFFTKSRNGDMSVELFYSWIGNHFLDYAPTGKPILLLISGNWPYVDMYVSRLCKDKQIILYCMPPYTNLFQEPLLWGFSRQLPLEWKRESMNFEILNPGMKVDRYAFPAVFSNVWTQQASGSNIMAAFDRSRIWPADPKNRQKTPTVPDHSSVQCFDEDGNAIEVAMYEEVTSEYPADVEQKEGNVGDVTSRVATAGNVKNGKPNLLQQFEEAQSLNEEQKDIFEARFLMKFEGQHDLVYNAWKALKELLVMKQDTTDDDDGSDIDDDDSLLRWLCDESDDDIEDDDDEKENIEGEDDDEESADDDGSKPDSDDEDEDRGSDESESDYEELDGDDEILDLFGLPSEFSEEVISSTYRGSSSRTAMSPLKITRYVHPGAVSNKRRRTSSVSLVDKKKKKKKKKKKVKKSEEKR